MPTAEPFLILGHRGSPRRHPENSLASLRAAVEEGADGFETDLRCLGDGSPVLYHDHDLDDAPIESYKLAALKERVCTLASVSELEEFAGRTRLVLEVKRVGWEEQLVSIVESWPNIVVSSFDHRVIRRLADRRFRGELGIIFTGCMNDLGNYARACGASWIFPHYRHVDEEMIASSGELTVVPWTPNTADEWSRLRDLGCSGVITDVPREAVEWRSSTR